jgi:hypothetical protein
MRHLQKSGIITLKALGGPIGSRTAQVQEAYEVHYSDGIRAAKKFSNERQAIQFAKDLIKSKKGLQFVDVFNAGSGFHSTADTDAIVAWWGDGSYTSNKSKHDSKLASKKIKEEVVKEGIENVANGLPQTMGKQKSLKREALKSIVREVMQEEAEYQKFFQKVLDKAGKSIPSMSDDEKKAFFNKVDAAWKAKQERD